MGYRIFKGTGCFLLQSGMLLGVSGLMNLARSLTWMIRMQLELILFTKLSQNYHYIPKHHRNIWLIFSPNRFASKSQSSTLAAPLRRMLPVKNLSELRNDSACEEINAVEDNLSS